MSQELESFKLNTFETSVIQNYHHKAWGTDRAKHVWTSRILTATVIATMLSQAIYGLFPIAFFLQGNDWSPFGYAVALVVVSGLGFIILICMDLWITFTNQEFFYLNYGLSTYQNEGNTTNTETTAVPAKLESVRLDRKKAFDGFIAAFGAALVVDIVLIWTWLDANHKFIPTHVGGATPNTPHPGYKDYWKFFVNNGAILYMAVLVIILGAMLLYRMFTDPKTITADTNNLSNELFYVNGPFFVVGILSHITFLGYFMVYIITLVGTTDNINMAVLAAFGFVLLFLCFVWVCVTFAYRNQVRKLPREVAFRVWTWHLLFAAFNVVQLIFNSYYLSLGQKALGGWRIPPFFGARAAIGQTSQFYFFSLNQILVIVSFTWWLPSFCEFIWFVTNRNSVPWAGDFGKTEVHVALLVFKAAVTLMILAIFGTAMSQATSSNYLLDHFDDWTYATIAILIAFWVALVICAGLIRYGKTDWVHYTYVGQDVSATCAFSAYVLIFVWITAYYYNNYDELKHNNGTSVIGDLSKPLYIRVEQMWIIFVLSSVPAVYYLMYFVAHPWEAFVAGKKDKNAYRVD